MTGQEALEAVAEGIAALKAERELACVAADVIRRAMQIAVSELEAENARLRIALHDAIRRPLGVTPDSAVEFYDPRMADEAEERRPMLSDRTGRWPAGCIKPNACARHSACMYAQSAEQCRHFGHDIRSDVEAASTVR